MNHHQHPPLYIVDGERQQEDEMNQQRTRVASNSTPTHLIPSTECHKKEESRSGQTHKSN